MIKLRNADVRLLAKDRSFAMEQGLEYRFAGLPTKATFKHALSLKLRSYLIRLCIKN